MYCPKASCASAATACSPTASANNCCPWLAHCSPHRVASRCLYRHCPIALRGTVPVAEKPCVSSSASPPQNFISQASIPHEHRRQHAPTACSLHVSAAVCASPSQQLKHHSNRIPKTPDPRSRCRRLTVGHPQRPKTGPQNHSPEAQILFNIHNPSQDHRNRGACGFLLTS